MPEVELTTESTVYVTYIAATPERVWSAITSSEYTAKFFFGDRHRNQVHLGFESWSTLRVIMGHFLGLEVLVVFSSLDFIDSRKR
jgi:uncharacterized protein YndB with AHSA1/START domain